MLSDVDASGSNRCLQLRLRLLERNLHVLEEQRSRIVPDHVPDFVAEQIKQVQEDIQDARQQLVAASAGGNGGN